MKKIQKQEVKNQTQEIPGYQSYIQRIKETLLGYQQLKQEAKKIAAGQGTQNRNLASILHDCYIQYPETTPTELWTELKTDSRISSCSGNFFKVSKIVREAKPEDLKMFLEGKLSFAKIYASVKGSNTEESVSSRVSDPDISLVEKLTLIAVSIRESYVTLSEDEKAAVHQVSLLLFGLSKTDKTEQKAEEKELAQV